MMLVTYCGFICRYRTNYSAVSRIYGVLTHYATQWYPKHLHQFYFFLFIFLSIVISFCVASSRAPAPVRTHVGSGTC